MSVVVEPPKPDRIEAFRLARRRFVVDGRVDVQDIAADLGVDRTTLYRWLGNRDTLVTDILISLADPTIRRLTEESTKTGAEKVADIAGSYAFAVAENEGYRAFLRREAERALRLITTKTSPLQQHVVGLFEDLLKVEHERGNFRHDIDRHDLAYLIVRFIESFIYSDLITGDLPDPSKVEPAIRSLLGGAGERNRSDLHGAAKPTPATE